MISKSYGFEIGSKKHKKPERKPEKPSNTSWFKKYFPCVPTLQNALMVLWDANAAKHDVFPMICAYDCHSERHSERHSVGIQGLGTRVEVSVASNI